MIGVRGALRGGERTHNRTHKRTHNELPITLRLPSEQNRMFDRIEHAISDPIALFDRIEQAIKLQRK